MFSVQRVFIQSKSPGHLLPILSCVYLALYCQNACVCGCLCVCVCVCVCVCALRIVSRDKSLHFKNTFIIIIVVNCSSGKAESWKSEFLAMVRLAVLYSDMLQVWKRECYLRNDMGSQNFWLYHLKHAVFYSDLLRFWKMELLTLGRGDSNFSSC